MRFIKTVCFLTVLSLFSTGCYMFTKSDSYYGIKTQGRNIVFLVDVSGSMEGKNEGNVTDKMRAQAMEKAGSKIGSFIGGRAGGLLSGAVKSESTKLASAKRELEPAIRGLGVDNSFTVISFGSKIDEWKDSLVAGSTGNTSLAIAYVKRLKSGGGTKALAGLKAAFDINKTDMIFFLSDGYPSDASSSKILEEIRNMNRDRNIVINCIGLGDNKDESFMKSLASENNGKYVEK